MQGAEGEAEGSVLTYVTEAEYQKQRSRSPSCNSLIQVRPQGSMGVGVPYPPVIGLRPPTGG